MSTATVVSYTVIVSPPQEDSYLVLSLEIHCPIAGTLEFLLLGQHLPAVKRAVDQAILEHPDLTLGKIRSTVIAQVDLNALRNSEAN